MSVSKVIAKVLAWLVVGLALGLVLTFVGYQFEDYAQSGDPFMPVFVGTYVLAVGAGALFFLAVSAVLYLMRLDKFFYFTVKAFLWFTGVNFLPAASLWVGTDVPIGWKILSIAGIFVGGYIAYNILAWVGAFLGASFEQLADAQPKGRQLLFAEALNLGYTKPQTRAFIDELNADGSRTNAGFVYTTLILYGIPFFAAMGIFYGR